jgi:hypothetical protein
METNGWPRTASARLGTDLSVRIGTDPEYWIEQNIPKLRSVQKANTCFQAKGFICFSAVTLFSYCIMETSKLRISEEELIETVRRYSNLYDQADKYYHDILRKVNALGKITAIIMSW